MISRNALKRTPERPGEYRKVVPDGEQECVWAEAGVIPYKLCDAEFDCRNCVFDMVMRGDNDLAPRKVWTRAGKICPHRFYHHCHTWAKIEGNALVRVGIDDFGQSILGPVENISLPIRDEKINRKSIRVRGRNTVISMICPVDGYVVEVNADLIEQPQLVNKSPYEKGWLVLLRPTRLVKNLKGLFYGTDALLWFNTEIYRLSALLSAELKHIPEEELGTTMQDGGLPDIEMLHYLPQKVLRKILEQCFLPVHSKDNFRT